MTWFFFPPSFNNRDARYFIAVISWKSTKLSVILGRYSNPLSNTVVRQADHGIWGKVPLCKLLVGNTGLSEHEHLFPLPYFLKRCTFLDILVI